MPCCEGASRRVTARVLDFLRRDRAATWKLWFRWQVRPSIEAVEAAWAGPREGVEQGSVLNRQVNFFPAGETVLVNFHLIPRKSMSQQDASRSAAEGAHIAG